MSHKELEKPLSAELPGKGTDDKNNEEDKPTQGSSFNAKILREIVYFVLIIMFIGVGTMFIAVVTLYIQSFHEKSSSYEDLKDQILLQNQKIDNLTEQLKTKKLP